MGRRYEITVKVQYDLEPGENEPKVKYKLFQALDKIWDFGNIASYGEVEVDDGTMKEMVVYGDDSLGGGKDEEAFAKEIADVVWETLGRPAFVEISSVYLEDLPSEFFSFDGEDFDKWKEKQCRS